MNRSNFEKWYPLPEIRTMYNITKILQEETLEITLVPYQAEESSLLMRFETSQCAFNVAESFSEEFWMGKVENRWSFYSTTHSTFLEYMQNSSVIFRECIIKPVHYVIVGGGCVFHIISHIPPTITKL